MKFIKLIKYVGLLLIVGFSVYSVLLYQLQDFYKVNLLSDEGMPGWKKALYSYPALVENRLYDLRMRSAMDKDYFEPRQVLAAIDEPSLQKIGRFPWTRAVYVQLLGKLKAYGAKTVAFDVVLSEPEMSCSGGLSPDIELAAAIKEFQSEKGKTVVLPYSTVGSNDQSAANSFPDILFNHVLNSASKKNRNLFANKIGKFDFPIPTLLASEPAVAYIGASEDLDGVFRNYPLVANIHYEDYGPLYLPSFALQTFLAFTDQGVKLDIDANGMGALLFESSGKGKFEEEFIELSNQGKTKVRWFGNTSIFPQVSIYKILEASNQDLEMQKLFRGNIVYIGSTAFGAHDLRHTPVDHKMPGIFFHMHMVQMLLEKSFYQGTDSSGLLSWAILIFGTFLMFGVSLLGNAVVDVIVVILFSGAVLLVDLFYLIPNGYEITIFFCLFSVVGSYSWLTFINFYSAGKDKKFLKESFGNYISPELIDIMYESGEKPQLGGQVGIITAYFTDIQSFSTFSEKLSAPQLVELLNEYLTAMTDILLEYGGTLDKYEGDAIIAFFGAPLRLEDHAVKACQVAVKMQLELLELRKKWVAEGNKWPRIVHEMRMRIGINSGEIVTGNMGSRTRMNYTMMGDSVNLAARLEEAAKQYGIFTHISGMTKELTDDKFICRELDTIRVVGKSEPVTTYEVLAEKGQCSDILYRIQEKFHQGLDHYKKQEWDLALQVFNQCLELEFERFPDLKGKKTNPSLVYLERVEQFQANPPGDSWDGVFTLTSK